LIIISRNLKKNINKKEKFYLTVKQQVSKYKYKQLYILFKKLCKYSKNLYNSALYNIRQYFFNTNKYLNYNNNYHNIKNNINYKLLEANCSNNILHIIDENFKSFFALKQKKLKCNIPKYLDKNDYFILPTHKIHINSNNEWIIPLSYQILKEYNLTSQSKDRFRIKIPAILKDKKIKYIQVIPKYKGKIFEIHYTYEIEINDNIQVNNNYLAIDLGINNLFTCISYNHNSNKKINSFILDGKELKSINQGYNRIISKLQKLNTNKKLRYTKKMYNILKKRNNKINYYIHKTCKKLIDYCLANNIKTIVLGWNSDFQRKTNLGRKNNQFFTSIPFSKIKDNLEYRCKMNNIKFVLQEESFTSKASFLDNDYMLSYKKDEKLGYVLRTIDNKVELRKKLFTGKRVKRGLYKSKNGILINADMNGALNILKKYLLNKEYEKIKQLNKNKCKVVSRKISYEDLIESRDIHNLYEDISTLYCRGALVAPIRIKAQESI